MTADESDEMREARLAREAAERELAELRARGRAIDNVERVVNRHRRNPDFVEEMVLLFRGRRTGER